MIVPCSLCECEIERNQLRERNVCFKCKTERHRIRQKLYRREHPQKRSKPKQISSYELLEIKGKEYSDCAIEGCNWVEGEGKKCRYRGGSYVKVKGKVEYVCPKHSAHFGDDCEVLAKIK